MSPQPQISIYSGVLQILWAVFMMLPGVYLSAWLDTKLGADLQARVGPSRAGSGGWLQPMADLLRLWQKWRPSAGPGRRTWLWWTQALPLFALVALTPVAYSSPVMDTELGVILALMMGVSFAWLGVLLSWSSGVLESRFSSIRQLALACSGLAPAALAVIYAGLICGGLSWESVAAGQGWAPWSWLAFQSPFALISAIIFILAGQLLFSAPPFELGSESLRWVVAAIPGETGIRMIWLRFGQRIAQLAWILISVRLFFGGPALPGVIQELLGDQVLTLELVGALVSFFKALTILAALSIFRRTLPSVRADQAHDFAWRVMCPMALLALMLSRLFGGAHG